jgi:radical SAM superfamily enzyme YgiQ (UPF0313 family)
MVRQLPSGTRSEIIDDDLAAALARAGCKNLVLAPESGSPRLLAIIKKKVNLDHLTAAISAARRHGLSIKTNHIVGFPDETRADILQTVRFAWRQAVLGVDATAFTLFTPYPGTELFDQMRKEGAIPALDDGYFRSLGAYLDPWLQSRYCKRVSGIELAFWRMLGMVSFFALSLALRPWRIARLGWNLLHNRAETILEHRLREWLGLSAPAVAPGDLRGRGSRSGPRTGLAEPRSSGATRDAVP